MCRFPARFKIADIKKDSDRCLKSSGSDPLTVMMKEDTEALRVLFDEMGFDNADGALGVFC